MEFFIPSLLLFLLAVIVSFVIVPKFTPLLIAILSIVLLTFGVYNHYKIFSAEYRLSTWQESLKIYAPAIMIAALILFIIYSILSFFSSGSVPVPIVPNVETPSANTATNAITSTLNSVTKTIGDTLSNVTNQITENIGANTGILNNVLNVNKNTNKNNLTRSILEII